MSTVQSVHGPRPTDGSVAAQPMGAERLLELSAAGDQMAFTRLYDQLAARVLGVCRRVLRDDAEAQDVTQEVFIEVWTKAARFDPAKGSASSWICRIAHHRAVDRVRSVEAGRRRDGVHAGQPQVHHDFVVERLIAVSDSCDVRRAVGRLSPRRREALMYALCTDYTFSQASVVLGIPLGTFKSRVRDALTAVRAALAAAD